MSKAIVLLSGGQDSSTCLFWAIKNFKEVYALGMNYGQRHAKELEQAALIASEAGVPFEVIDLRGTLGGSSLTDHSLDLNKPHQQFPELPSSFTPGRNALFLVVAAIKAVQMGAADIVTGVCQTDFSGYPDCRRVFVDAMQTALTLANYSIENPLDIRIHTPLMYLTKAETWKLAKDLEVSLSRPVVNIIREMTLTDYNGDTSMNEWGMGRDDNPASHLRKKGYEEALANGWL